MNQTVFDVRRFGAAGDGVTKDTAAVQQTIDAACRSGGGRVLLQGGTFVCGTLFLRSGLCLEIAENACLMASPDLADYSTEVHHNRYRNETELDRCFLYAEDAESVTLTGAGVISGNAAAFPNPGTRDRPMLMRFLRCLCLRIQGLQLRDSASWTTAFLDSRHITVRDVCIFNETHCNGDGLDFDGCSYVTVENCRIRGTDDNLCLQSSSREWPVHHIRVRNCSFSSICAAVRIGLKSIGEIRDVEICDCRMENVWREGIKIECSEGGSIRDIRISGITMQDVRRPLFLLLNNRFEPRGLGSSLELHEMPEIGTMENITISDLVSGESPEMEKTHRRFGKDIMGSPRFGGIRVDAERSHPIRGLTLRGLSCTVTGGVRSSEIPEEYPEVLDRIRSPDGPCSENYWPDWSRTSLMDIRNVDGLTLEDVRLQVRKEDGRPRVLLSGCRITRLQV